METMKKLTALALALLLLACRAPAMAQEAAPVYTLDAKGTVLQGEGDRGIAAAEGALDANPVIPGQSTVTGLPLADGLYLPMLVQVSNAYANGDATPGSRTDYTPWGLQHADILYESLLYAMGQTRYTALFSDSFADGQPTSVGPVRSARMSQVLLGAQWQGGVVFTAGYRREGENIFKSLGDLGLTAKGLTFSAFSNDHADAFARLPNVSRDSMDVNPVILRNKVPETTVSQPHPFLFADESPYDGGYAAAHTVWLDWGHEDYVSRFSYDESSGLYMRYKGNGDPFVSYASGGERDPETQIHLGFSNVILQRVSYEQAAVTRPVINAVGQGNADIFICGRYIPGYWVCESEHSPTVFLDNQGQEIVLSRGKTYIAHLPPEALAAYDAQ